MNFVLRAVPQDEFERWVATARQAGPELDRASYIAASQERLNVRPFTYRTVDPTLFDQIVSRQIPPGPGPRTGPGGLVQPLAQH